MCSITVHYIMLERGCCMLSRFKCLKVRFYPACAIAVCGKMLIEIASIVGVSQK